MVESPRISIIITTCRQQILTLESLKHCLVPYQLIITRKHGLGYARNWAARQACAPLIIFFDDDIKIKEEIWSELLLTRRGEFKMLKFSDVPATRVFAIHADDFWSVNGFDEKIKYCGEDRDFYLRAVKHGLKLKLIPANLVTHIPHANRLDNPKIGTLRLLEYCRLVARHGNKYIGFKTFFLGRSNLPRFASEIIKLFGLAFYTLRLHILEECARIIMRARTSNCNKRNLKLRAHSRRG